MALNGTTRVPSLGGSGEPAPDPSMVRLLAEGEGSGSTQLLADNPYVTWETARSDPAGMLAGDTVTIQKAGTYLVLAQVLFQSVGDNDRQYLQLWVNGGFTAETRETSAATGSSAPDVHMEIAEAREFAAGDSLRFQCKNGSDTGNIGSSGSNTRLAVVKLGENA